jgi:hypothetical protein
MRNEGRMQVVRATTQLKLFENTMNYLLTLTDG